MQWLHKTTRPMLMALWLLSGSFIAVVNAQLPPISSGYGANGRFTLKEENFPSPRFTSVNVSVFHPAETNAPLPVIFFAPGFSVTDPVAYRPLIQHIVSRGYVVVFSPFQTLLLDLYRVRYDTIFAGYEEAVRRYGSLMDTRRAGFMGHSFGGGASFSLLQRGVARGWGSDGLLLFATAPWYVYDITAEQLIAFPTHAKVMVQIYEADGVCDHRIARDVVDRLGLPASEKDLMMLRSDEFNDLRLSADHNTPSAQTTDALDFYGVWRTFDALADYAFNGNRQGQVVALGNGPEQRFMGNWTSTRPVREALVGECIPITRPSSSFTFAYDQTIHDASVTSAASFTAPVAPGSIASVFGKLFSPSSAANTAAELPTKLNGTFVRVRDSACVERVAPLFFVAPGQVNFHVPAETASGAGTVLIYNEAGAVSAAPLNVANVVPGIFTANANGMGVAAAVALRIGADGSQRYEALARYDEAQRRFVAQPLGLNADEAVYLILFGTGWRNRSGNLSNVSVTIGGVPAEVSYAGPQGVLIGLDQLNVRVPNSLRGRGEVDVAVVIESRAANVVKLNLQ